MSFQAKLMITLLLLGNAVLVIELLRRRLLTESYTLLWLVVVGFTTAATWANWFLDFLATFFGAIAPVSALTLLSLVFILVMLIYFSMKISRLGRDVKELAQELALRTFRESDGGHRAGKPDASTDRAHPSGEDP